MNKQVLVDIQNLSVDYIVTNSVFRRNRRTLRVLDNFNLQIYSGETLGVVGESGCGKTTLANSVARFVRPTTGQVLFEGRDILTMKKPALRQQRREIQMVFQNPFNSLNPRMDVLALVGEPLVTHLKIGRDELKERVVELLLEVGLGPDFTDRHSYELSGGQAQRVAIARAIALNPKMLMLDEPTSALDLSVQAQIINLLEEIQEKHNMTYLFISHGLAVVQHISKRIAVLYMGEIVELAFRDDIFRSPAHPYSQALFSSTPIPDPDSGRKRIILQGIVPSPSNPPTGCRFHTRCPKVMNVCRKEKPPAHTLKAGHWATCHLFAQ